VADVASWSVWVLPTTTLTSLSVAIGEASAVAASAPFAIASSLGGLFADHAESPYGAVPVTPVRPPSSELPRARSMPRSSASADLATANAPSPAPYAPSPRREEDAGGTNGSSNGSPSFPPLSSPMAFFIDTATAREEPTPPRADLASEIFPTTPTPVHLQTHRRSVHNPAAASSKATSQKTPPPRAMSQGREASLRSLNEP
jgi:hypothetical protein